MAIDVPDPFGIGEFDVVNNLANVDPGPKPPAVYATAFGWV